MKLVRYGNPGKEKPGLVDAEGRLRDLCGVIDDIGGASSAKPRWPSCASSRSTRCRWCAASRASACRSRDVGKFIGIGLNYADHAAEAGMPLPEGADRVHEGHQLHVRARTMR